MPKFAFDCECGVRFTRTLKMGEHPTHTCPRCEGAASRYWEGQGFSHAFAQGSTPGNSGVSLHDYPDADRAVGSSADARWSVINEREKVKKKVREMGGSRALVRQQGEGDNYIQYTAGDDKLVEDRKKLVKSVEAQGWGVPEKEAT